MESRVGYENITHRFERPRPCGLGGIEVWAAGPGAALLADRGPSRHPLQGEGGQEDATFLNGLSPCLQRGEAKTERSNSYGGFAQGGNQLALGTRFPTYRNRTDHVCLRPAEAPSEKHEVDILPRSRTLPVCPHRAKC